MYSLYISDHETFQEVQHVEHLGELESAISTLVKRTLTDECYSVACEVLLETFRDIHRGDSGHAERSHVFPMNFGCPIYFYVEEIV